MKIIKPKKLSKYTGNRNVFKEKDGHQFDLMLIFIFFRLETNLQIIFMQNIIELIDRDYLFESDQHYFEFLVRLYWLRCHLFLYRGQTNLAIAALNDVLACYELHSKFESVVLPLRNCRKNNVISKAIAEEFLADQSRYL